MDNYYNELRSTKISILKDDTCLCECIYDNQGNPKEGSLDVDDIVIRAAVDEILTEKDVVSGTICREISTESGKLTLKAKRYIDCTMADISGIMAERYPYKVALIDKLGKRSLTFEEVNAESDSLAKAIISLGVKKGQHIGVIMDNCWEQVVVKFAIVKAGAVITNISYHEKKDELCGLIVNDDVVMVFVKQSIPKKEHMDMFYQNAPELLDNPKGELKLASMPQLKYIVVTNPERPRLGTVTLQSLIAQGNELPDELLEERRAQLSAFDECSIIHTSGSTGKPKAVVLCHWQLVENVISHIKVMNMTDDDVLCMTPPMFHAFGTIGSFLSTYMCGGTVVLYDNAGEIQLLDIVINDKVTVICSVPTIFIRLCANIRSRKLDMHACHVRLCVTAGAPCPPALVKDINNYIGARDVVGMYGMTETSPGLASHTCGDSIEVISNTLGKMWPGVEYKIADPESGKHVPDGETGEICVRGYMVMKGYYKNEAETAKIIDADGWVHTGDLALVRPDGNLVFKGRCKDLIISKGENISPVEVEACIKACPKVDSVAVVGAPDDNAGEIVYAFIVPKEDCTINLDEIKKWCKGKIATIKIPEVINVLQEMPVMANGKTDKKVLKKIVADAYAK